METKPIYTLFPHPKTPTTSTQSPHRPRHSIDHKRRTSLDPLPPIEEPPHLPAALEAALPESPVLKPIHSLYNPQPARPSSSRGTSKRQERRKSLNHSLLPSENSSPFRRDLPPDQNSPLNSQQAQPISRSSSLKEQPRLSHNAASPSESPPRPSTAQGMHISSPSLTLGARVLIPSPSSSSSVSLSKPPILSPTSTVAPGKPFPGSGGPNQTQYNKTPYFHGGIGGRGNYRKVKREDKRAPLAYAPNAGPPNGRSKFLSNLFWGRSRRKGISSDGEGADGRTSEDSLSGSRGSSEREEVALGAAEAIRRKLLRQAGVKSYRRADY